MLGYFRDFGSRIKLNRKLARFIARFSREGVPMALVTGTSEVEVRRVVPARFLNGILSAKRTGAGFVLALASSLAPRHLKQADKVVASTAMLCRMLEKLTVRHNGR